MVKGVAERRAYRAARDYVLDTKEVYGRDLTPPLTTIQEIKRHVNKHYPIGDPAFPKE